MSPWRGLSAHMLELTSTYSKYAKNSVLPYVFVVLFYRIRKFYCGFINIVIVVIFNLFACI